MSDRPLRRSLVVLSETMAGTNSNLDAVATHLQHCLMVTDLMYLIPNRKRNKSISSWGTVCFESDAWCAHSTLFLQMVTTDV